MSAEIRIRQLVAPSGVGAIVNDTGARSMLVRSLDHWYPRDQNIDPSDFTVSDPRLSGLLRVLELRSPPEFRSTQMAQPEDRNLGLEVPGFRFPTWWVCKYQQCHSMRKRAKGEASAPKCENPSCKRRGRPMVQIPLVMVCEQGCISDVPWREILQCPPDCDSQVLSGTGGIPERRVRCSQHCPNGIQLGDIMRLAGYAESPIRASGLAGIYLRATGNQLMCPGDWAWQDGSRRPCSGSPSASFLNALSLHSTITMSSLLIPAALIGQGKSSEAALREALVSTSPDFAPMQIYWPFVQQLREDRVPEDSAQIKKYLDPIRASLRRSPELARYAELVGTELCAALDRASAPGSTHRSPAGDLSVEARYRSEEHDVLLGDHRTEELVTEHLALPAGTVGTMLSSLARVRRLRQTTVGLGFYRLRPPQSLFDGRRAVRRAARQYFAKHRDLADDAPIPNDVWLPAVQVHGEGIFVSLSESALEAWWTADGSRVMEITAPSRSRYFAERRSLGSLSPVRNVELTPLAPMDAAGEARWFARYVLVHSLSHALMFQLAFDCGYTMESVAERIYVSIDRDLPMAGVLLYTAAGDSDGTLGGLSALADPGAFSRLLIRAMVRSSFCSNDPICHEGAATVDGGIPGFNGAACHCCSMVPDLCCETGNRLLDRRILVDPECGFFRRLLVD
jgi:hypothetical protein